MKSGHFSPFIPSTSRPPIWVQPFFTLSTIIGVSITIFLMTNNDNFLEHFRQPKADVLKVVGYYFYIWLMVSLGLAISRLFNLRNYSRQRPEMFGPYLALLGVSAFSLTAFAFLLWFTLTGFSFQGFLNVFASQGGAFYILRATFFDNRLPGLTSLINLAPWWFVYIAYRRFVRERPLSRFQLIASALFVIVFLIYSIALGERRQLITLFVPAIVAVLLLRPPARSEWVTWMPAIGLLGLVLLFLVGEYFRTWANYYAATSGQDYIPWALIRLGGYYATSINNGVNYLTYLPPTGGWLTFDGILKMPGINLWSQMPDIGTNYIRSFYGNPEFTNPGGLIVPLIDFGLLGGGAFLFIFGMLTGLVWHMARRGSIFYILLYTQLYFALLESTRIFYALSSAGVTNLLFLILYSLVWSIARTGGLKTTKTLNFRHAKAKMI